MGSTVATITNLPLFPLSTVLFPEGQLRLRIFEPRYLDMVRECTGKGSPFGVCLILEGQEVGAPATPAAVGTLARITDFFIDDDGILVIHAQGQERFRVQQVHLRDTGLVRGDVACWEPEPKQELPPEFGLLADILHRLIEQAAPQWSQADASCFDRADWVGFRLAELLPLDPSERQPLLEMRNPLQRLTELRDLLPRFQRD
jgi:Lon protease-like protein